MKKFILPLMLLLLVGALFAVESDPSAVVGYVKYECVAGNNMVALPMQTDFVLAGAFAESIGAASIGYFNTVSQVWTISDEFPWGGWSNDFPIATGDPLWVYTDAATDFYSIGDLPVPLPSYALVAGNNTIMLPLNKSSLTLAGAVAEDIGAVSIGYFNNVSQVWTISDEFPWGGWSQDFATSIGDPLWLYTDTAGNWPAAPSKNNVKLNTKD